MPALGWHITSRLEDESVRAPTIDHQRRLAACIWGRSGASRTLAFFAVGDHLHVLTALDRREADRFAHDIEASMHWQLGLRAPFQPARIRAVESHEHLECAFWYVLRQPLRHDLPAAPPFEASSLADLLGLRTLGAAHRATVRELLPQVRRPQLLRLATELAPRVPPEAFDPAAPRADQGLPWLGESMASAAGVVPAKLSFRLASGLRVAAAHAVPQVRLRGVAAGLGVSYWSAKRARRGVPDPSLSQAIRRQLQLRAYLPPTSSSASAP